MSKKKTTLQDTSSFKRQTFKVMFTTMGNKFCAGEFTANSVDTGKAEATTLLKNRKVASLDSAEILDEDGNSAAVLRKDVYPARIEWVTIRSL